MIEGDKSTAGGKTERQMPENTALDCPEGGRQVQGISRQWKPKLISLFHEAFPLAQVLSNGSVL